MDSVVPELHVQVVKGRRPRPFLLKISKFCGPYLANPWPDWPKIWDLVLWDHTQQAHQVSSKSKMVGLKFSFFFFFFFFGWFDMEWPLSSLQMLIPIIDCKLNKRCPRLGMNLAFVLTHSVQTQWLFECTCVSCRKLPKSFQIIVSNDPCQNKFNHASAKSLPTFGCACSMGICV